MSVFQDDETKIVKDWPPQSPDLNPTETLWDAPESTFNSLCTKKVSHTNIVLDHL